MPGDTLTTLNLTSATLTSKPSAIRALVVHRNPEVARGLAIILGAERGIEVTRTALTIPVGASFARLEQPDVIILDGDMPAMSATWSMSYLRAAAPAARFVLLSSGTLERAPAENGVPSAELVLATYPVEVLVQAVRRSTFRGSPSRILRSRAA